MDTARGARWFAFAGREPLVNVFRYRERLSSRETAVARSPGFPSAGGRESTCTWTISATMPPSANRACTCTRRGS